MKEIVTVSAHVSQQSRGGIHAERVDDDFLLRIPSLSRLMRAVLPNQAVRHMQAARREQLLAVRAVLDAAISRMEAPERDEKQTTRCTEIRID